MKKSNRSLNAWLACGLAAALAASAGSAQDGGVYDAGGYRLDGAKRPSAAEASGFDAAQTPVYDVVANSLSLERVNALRALAGLPALSAADYTVAADGLVTQSGGEDGLPANVRPPLPSYVDNSALAQFPPMRAQGAQANGAVWAAVYYLHTYATARQNHWAVSAGGQYAFSPKFVYPAVNGGEDAGASLEAAILFLARHGAATMADFDYANAAAPASTASEFRAWDRDGAHWRDALDFRAGRFGRQDGLSHNEGLFLVKQRLANGDVLAAVSAGEFTWMPLADADLPSAGRGDPAAVCLQTRAGAAQAIVLVGYDDAAWVDANANGERDPGEVGAFKVALTQGAGFTPAGCVNAGGFAWLLYDAAMADSELYAGASGREAAFRDGAVYWVEPSGETPSLLARVTVNLPVDRVKLSLGIAKSGVERPESESDWTFPAVAGGAYGFDGAAYTGAPSQKATFWFDWEGLTPDDVAADPSAFKAHRWFANLDGLDAADARGVTDFRLFAASDELADSLEENYLAEGSLQYRWIDEATSDFTAATGTPYTTLTMYGYMYDISHHLGAYYDQPITDADCAPLSRHCTLTPGGWTSSMTNSGSATADDLTDSYQDWNNHYPLLIPTPPTMYLSGVKTALAIPTQPNQLPYFRFTWNEARVAVEVFDEPQAPHNSNTYVIYWNKTPTPTNPIAFFGPTWDTWTGIDRGGGTIQRTINGQDYLFRPIIVAANQRNFGDPDPIASGEQIEYIKCTAGGQAVVGETWATLTAEPRWATHTEMQVANDKLRRMYSIRFATGAETVMAGPALDAPTNSDYYALTPEDITSAAAVGATVTISSFWNLSDNADARLDPTTRTYYLKVANCKVVFGQDQTVDNGAVSYSHRYDGIPIEAQFTSSSSDTGTTGEELDEAAVYNAQHEYRLYAEVAPVRFWSTLQTSLDLEPDYRINLGIPYFPGTTLPGGYGETQDGLLPITMRAPQPTARTGMIAALYPAAPHRLATSVWRTDAVIGGGDDAAATYQAEISWLPISGVSGWGGLNPLVRDHQYYIAAYTYYGSLIPSDPHIEWFTIVGNDSMAGDSASKKPERLAAPYIDKMSTNTFTHYPQKFILKTTTTTDAYFRYHLWGNRYDREDMTFENRADDFDDPYTNGFLPYFRVVDDGWIRYVNTPQNNFDMDDAGGVNLTLFSYHGPNDPPTGDRAAYIRTYNNTMRAFYSSSAVGPVLPLWPTQMATQLPKGFALHDPNAVYFGHRLDPANAVYPFAGEGPGASNPVIAPADPGYDPYAQQERLEIQVRRSALIYAKAYRRGTDTSWLANNTVAYSGYGTSSPGEYVGLVPKHNWTFVPLTTWDASTQFVGSGMTPSPSGPNRQTLNSAYPFPRAVINPTLNPLSQVYTSRMAPSPIIIHHIMLRTSEPRYEPAGSADEANPAPLDQPYVTVRCDTLAERANEQLYIFYTYTDTNIPAGHPNDPSSANNDILITQNGGHIPMNNGLGANNGVIRLTSRARLFNMTFDPENNIFYSILGSGPNPIVPSGVAADDPDNPTRQLARSLAHVRYYRLVVQNPYFITPSDVTYTGSVLLKFGCDTTDSVIRFTLDGSPVTGSSSVYDPANPPTIHVTSTVNIKAYKAGLNDSEQMTATYTVTQSLTQVNAPVITPPSGMYANTFPVSITTSTAVGIYGQDTAGKVLPTPPTSALGLSLWRTAPNIRIYYTTDGTIPYPKDLVDGGVFPNLANPNRNPNNNAEIPSNSEHYTGEIPESVVFAGGLSDVTVRAQAYDLNYLHFQNLAIASHGANATPGQIAAMYESYQNIRVSSDIASAVYTIQITIPVFTVLNPSAKDGEYTDGTIAGTNNIYVHEVQIELDSTTVGAELYYTINQADPEITIDPVTLTATPKDANTHKYVPAQPLAFNSHQLIKAIAFMPGTTLPASRVVSMEFRIKAATPTLNAVFTDLNGDQVYNTNDDTFLGYVSVYAKSATAELRPHANPDIDVTAGMWNDVAQTSFNPGVQVRYNVNTVADPADSNAVIVPWLAVDGMEPTAADAKNLPAKFKTYRAITQVKAKTFGIAGKILDSDVVDVTFRVKALAPILDPTGNGRVFTTALQGLTGANKGITITADQPADPEYASAGIILYFTTDGTTPTPGGATTYTFVTTSPNLMNRERNVIELLTSGTHTIKVVAYKEGMVVSDVVTEEYVLELPVVVGAPTFSINGVATTGGYYGVQINLAVKAAVTSPANYPTAPTIYYTLDGTDPSNASAVYTTPFAVSQATTVKAIAYCDGFASPISTASFFFTIDPVTFSPPSGVYAAAQSVTLASTTANTQIRYTTDGSEPTATTGTVYTGTAIPVSASTTIKAAAFYTDAATGTSGQSRTIEGLYKIGVAGPTITPATHYVPTAGANITVTITPTYAGSDIYYTTNNTNPSVWTSTKYTGPFVVQAGAVIRAREFIYSGTSWSYSNEATPAEYFSSIKAPVLSPAGGLLTSPVIVTATAPTSGTTVYYTTDGSNPSIWSSATYRYDSASAGIAVTKPTTIKARAFYQQGGVWYYSDVATAVFDNFVSPVTFSPTPGLMPAGGTEVTMSSTMANAVICYTTDGSNPSVWTSTRYTGPIKVAANTTFRARAFIGSNTTGWIYSDATTASYVLQYTPPTILPGTGSYNSTQRVTITAPEAGVEIRYTTDGSNPTVYTGILYTGEFIVSSTTTIRARSFIKVNNVWYYSNESMALMAWWPAAATPAFDPPSATYTSSTMKPITITTSTPNATIYYTTDGTAPSATNGYTYTGPFSVSGVGSFTVKAVAVAASHSTSAVATANYTINYGKAAAPVITPTANPNHFTTPLNVKATSATAGATLRYTTDDKPVTMNSAVLPADGVTFTTTGTKVIRVRAFADYYDDSDETRVVYTLYAPSGN